MAKEACRENHWIPEWDPNRKPFEGWAARTWNWYYLRGLNKLLPPEECGMPLTEEEKREYLQDLARLRDDREKHPGIPISYDMVELEWD